MNENPKGLRLTLLVLHALIMVGVHCGVQVAVGGERQPDNVETPWAQSVSRFVTARCLDCHNSETREGGLDLSKLAFDFNDNTTFNRWVQIHDRVRDGEMPPDNELDAAETSPFLEALREPLVASDRRHIAREGRAVVRRMNRYEFENALRRIIRLTLAAGS